MYTKTTLAIAAEWILKSKESELSEHEKLALSAWLNESVAHQDLWNKAALLMSNLDQLPASTGKKAYQKHGVSRRTFLSMTGLLAVGTAATVHRYSNGPEWVTGIGEQVTYTIDVGVKVRINAESKVSYQASSGEHSISLHTGDLMIESDPNRTHKPIVIRAHDLLIRPIGTVFSVSHGTPTLEYQIRLHVMEGQVLVTQLGQQPVTLSAGEQLTYDALDQTLLINHVQGASVAWIDRRWVVNGWSLDQLLNELHRYHAGHTFCDDITGQLVVFGIFDLYKKEEVLAQLAKTFPIKIRRVLPSLSFITAY